MNCSLNDFSGISAFPKLCNSETMFSGIEIESQQKVAKNNEDHSVPCSNAFELASNFPNVDPF